MSQTSDELRALFLQPRLKLIRAKEHVFALQREVRAYLDSVNCQIVLTQTKPGHMRWNVKVSRPQPPQLPLIMGDAVHNLRTSLDWLAICAVIANGGSEKRVYFPFASDKDEFEKQITAKNFSRAAPQVVDIVRSLEPYKGGNRDLRLVHDLDIKDKHRQILDAAMGYIPPPINIVGRGPVYDIDEEGNMRVTVKSAAVRPYLRMFNGLTGATVETHDISLVGQPIDIYPTFYITEAPMIFYDGVLLAQSMHDMTESVIDQITEAAIEAAMA